MTLRKPIIDHEISKILQLAYSKRASGRTELFNSITEMMEHRHHELTVNERLLMSEILEKLLTNIEMNVRINLANRLASDKEAPIDLIILLANDQIEVAKSVLSVSQLLTDDELIKIIHHKTLQHQLSIAGRSHLSSDISRELVTVGNTKTLLALINNHKANIDEATLSLLVEKSKDNIHIQPPLIERPDLPRGMSLKMYQWVSDNLKKTILNGLKLEESEINDLIEQTIEDLQEKDDKGHSQEKSEILLVNKLYDAGKLSPGFLIKCLNNGQSSLFEIAFSKLINIPNNIIRSFLYNRGPEALAVSCCAAGIDRSVFLSIYELTRTAQNMPAKISPDEIAIAFEHFKKLDKKRSQRLLQKWVAEATGTAIF